MNINADAGTLFFKEHVKLHVVVEIYIQRMVFYKDAKIWYYYCYGEECNKKVFKIGEENTYLEKHVSSFLEKMETIDHFHRFFSLPTS